MRGRPSNVFTSDAVFTPENSEGWTATDLDELYVGSPEDDFLRGQVLYVGASSSNVEWFQWLGFYPDGAVQNQLYVGFKDGSVYEYSDISLSESLLFFRAGSAGGIVWDQLRIRGTVYGYKKSYKLVSGNRLWNTTAASQARHQAIPRSGEPSMPFGTYHPLTNWQGAPGKMGKADIRLSKRQGSKKKAYFVPINVFGQKLP